MCNFQLFGRSNNKSSKTVLLLRHRNKTKFSKTTCTYRVITSLINSKNVDNSQKKKKTCYTITATLFKGKQNWFVLLKLFFREYFKYC